MAWASASGKSYFAKKLQKALEQKWKKVILIGSDNYYSNESALKYVLYGTFDHPHLIEYAQLQKDLQQYFSTGVMNQPIYSFVEKRTIDHLIINQEADYVIVEGIYTISELEWIQIPNTKIFVDSSEEELIFRRLIRDQERVAEPMHMIIENLWKVFPMWNIYGFHQKNDADIIIYNDYEILDHKGTRCSHITTHQLPEWIGELDMEKEINSFHYSDNNPENGDIIVSEVYYWANKLLRYVQISKIKAGTKDEQQSIDIRLYQPGILTSIHTLLQTAGIPFRHQTNSVERVYRTSHGERTFMKHNGHVVEKCQIS